MPIYEYQCANCHHKFELIQKISAEPAKQCPECLMNTAERLVSAPGFQLKGTGWYATDFKDKGKPPQDKKSSEGNTEVKHSGSKDTSSKTKGEKD